MLTEFRDPIARAKGNPGFLYRSARLDQTTLDERTMLSRVLQGGQVIDLRTPGRAAREPDPQLPGVRMTRLSLPPTSYVGYDGLLKHHRATLRQVLLAIFSDGPTLVHCTEGKDRTGIVVALAMFALYFTPDQVKAEFLSTEGALESNWHVLMDTVGPDPVMFARNLLDLKIPV